MCFFFFMQKTAYDMRISDWSSDVCSSDLRVGRTRHAVQSPHGDAHIRAIGTGTHRPGGAPHPFAGAARIAGHDRAAGGTLWASPDRPVAPITRPAGP